MKHYLLVLLLMGVSPLLQKLSIDTCVRGALCSSGASQVLFRNSPDAPLHDLRDILNQSEQTPQILQGGSVAPKPASSIPQLIVQALNRKHALPPTISAALRSWQALNPEYTHEVHDLTDMHGLIADRFHETFVEIFDSLGQFQQKADLWRLCYLFINGGVYVDADYAPMSPLRETLPRGITFAAAVSAPVAIDPMQPPVGCHTRADAMKRMQNGFIAVARGHPLLLLALQKLRWNFYRREDQHYLMAMGPALLYEAYAILFGDPLASVLRGPGMHGVLAASDMRSFLGRAHRPDVCLLMDMGGHIWSVEPGQEPQARLMHKYPGWIEEIASMSNDNATRLSHGGTCLRKFR